MSEIQINDDELRAMALTLNWEEMELRKFCGVYMLMGNHITGNDGCLADNIVLYVGQTVSFHARIAMHWGQRRIPFWWVRFASVRPKYLDAVEKFLIERHRPPYNSDHAPTGKIPRGLPNHHLLKLEKFFVSKTA